MSTKEKPEYVNGRHKGRLIENSLYELADSGSLPDLESNLITAAADYIHWLEAQLRYSDEAF